MIPDFRKVRKEAKRRTAEFLADDRGQMQGMAQAAVGLVVALTVAAIVSAFLLPIGITELVAVDTTNWSDGASSLWGILDVIIVLSLFIFLVTMSMSATDM